LAPPPLFPHLRALRLSHSALDGTEGVGLTDPLGVSPMRGDRSLDLSPADWAVLRRFDGLRSASEVAAAASAELDHPVSEAAVTALEARASELLLLRDERYRSALEREFEAFRRQAVRAAVGPGRDYERDSFELRVRIGGLVADDWDLPPLPQAQGLWSSSSSLDLAGPLYSRAYAAVRHCRPELSRVVLLGSIGAALDSRLVPLSKPFETPLGRVEPDTEGLAALGHLPGLEQLAHRDGLELERQMLFLRLLFPGLPVLPILVASPRREAGELETWETRGDDEVERAVEGLRAVLALEGRTLMIAAADLFRWGRRRGRSEPAPRHTTLLGGTAGNRIRDADREAIDAATRLDPDAFLAVAFDEEDPVRLGLAAAPYLMLRALEGRRSLVDDTAVQGSTLGYLQMPAAGQITTAAAVVFH
jgi:AmmeMemoRadiSam system protein B